MKFYIKMWQNFQTSILQLCQISKLTTLTKMIFRRGFKLPLTDITELVIRLLTKKRWFDRKMTVNHRVFIALLVPGSQTQDPSLKHLQRRIDLILDLSISSVPFSVKQPLPKKTLDFQCKTLPTRKIAARPYKPCFVQTSHQENIGFFVCSIKSLLPVIAFLGNNLILLGLNKETSLPIIETDSCIVAL